MLVDGITPQTMVRRKGGPRLNIIAGTVLKQSRNNFEGP
jgi:hypothetical protein